MSTSNASPTDKPRLLSDKEKKNNHIASEQKRREAIRIEQQLLTTVIPGTSGKAASDAVVLQATVDYLKEQLKRKEGLRADTKQLGISEGDFEHMYREEAAKAYTGQDAT